LTIPTRLLASGLALSAWACSVPPRLDRLRPIRIAVRASESTHEISTLSYKGGFETKTLVYETLVRRDGEGRIAPALAQSWHFEKDGTECVLELRQNALFHDGTPVTAEAVRQHFRRWVGLPEHDWLHCNQRIREVVAEGPRTLRIRMDEPCALLPELCAINPCAIRAPSTLDFEGNFVQPVGSGPFAWEGMDSGARVLHYSLRQRPGKDGLAVSRVDLVKFTNERPDAPVDELLAGRLDAVFDGWRERIPRSRIAALRADRNVRVLESPGSSVVSLGFRTEGGPCADASLRKAIRAAIDRADLVERVELGHADPCTGLAAPSVKEWPLGRTQAVPGDRWRAPIPRLRLLARSDSDYEPALAQAIAGQLRRAGLPVDTVLLHGEVLARALESGAFDLRLESTWGVPYDPDISLGYRFGPPLDHPSGENPPAWGQDAALTALVVEARKEWDEERRRRIYARVQDRIDDAAVLVPLYVPRRFAVLQADLPQPDLDHDLYRIDAASVAPATIVRQP